MAHLTQEQRHTIAQMKKNGFPRKEICKVIGKDKSVLSRERFGDLERGRPCD
jgi:IS30 family transposase